jgi:eukaryotic-like serine/threonine-protein kinase
MSAPTQFGAYEVRALLGAGGMGEVYRATDPRLGRDVAIKVLPAAFAADAERLARFEREAKLLASLNHPNVAHVYGFERATMPDGSGVHFLAMELVEGEDLAERLKRGAIPVEEALGIAKQIVEALEAAHEKGIVHRDLKPANIKVTSDGKVKVLDFGLAKTYAGDAASGSAPDLSNSPTLARTGTEAGLILGTAAYMSPEQARGKAVDKKADIWAFGVVLYEMLTGRRLFDGETVSDVLAAVLKTAPDFDGLPADVPPHVRRLLGRCLRKDPRERLHDIADARIELSDKEEARPTTSGAGGPTRPGGWLPWLVAVGVSVVALGLGAALWRQHAATPSPPRFEKLTFAPQFVTNARFAPDGRTVVFSAAREGNTSQLFVRHPGDPQPRSLGGPNMKLLSVSSKGELAVLTRTRYRSHRDYIGTLARMPLAEAAPREVLNDVTGADWSPDGTELAIIRQVPGKSRLEYPIGTVLKETPGYFSDVRVSAKGDRIAFMSHAFEGDNRGSVVVVDRGGAVVAKSPEYSGEEGVAWAVDGASVLFASSDEGSYFPVRALAMDGTVREVLTDSTGLSVFDTSREGRLLVSTYDHTLDVVALFAGAPAERVVPWLEQSIVPVLSRDGRRLLFSDASQIAGPNYSVYVGAASGSPPVRLGEGIGVDLSPDAASVLVVVPASPPRLMVYPTGAGEPRDISARSLVSYEVFAARFSEDGRSVAFCGAEAGKASRCYVRDLHSQQARPVTPEGTSGGSLSPDGRAMVARGADGRFQLYPLDGGGASPVPGLDDRDVIIHWRDARSLLVHHPTDMPTRVERLDLKTGQRTLLRELAPVDRAGAVRFDGVSFSTDEKSYAYSVSRFVGALFTVEGVRWP